MSPPTVTVTVKPIPVVTVPVPAAVAPLFVPHLYWDCIVNSELNDYPSKVHALIDDSSHAVLINDDLVTQLGLRRHCLHEPEKVKLAISPEKEKQEFELTHWVKLKLHNPSSFYSTQTIKAIIAPYLCVPVIIRLPFLVHNNIIVDHEAKTVINKKYNFDLLNPVALQHPKLLPKKLKEVF